MSSPRPNKKNVDFYQVANPLATIRKHIGKWAKELEALMTAEETLENEERMEFLM